MSYLLNIFYLVLLALAWPWLAYKSIRQGKYREGFGAKFLGSSPIRQGSRPCLWLHAVSVGEVNLLGTLLNEIRRQRPEWECVISTTTSTGYALARKKYASYTVFFCPLDFSWAVRRAMRRLRPDCLVLAELELWPNLIRAARERGARVAVINGRLSQHSHRGYCRIRPLMAGLLGQLDLIAVQNEEYRSRFLDLGAKPDKVRITGSIKFDGAQTDRNNQMTLRLRQLAGIKETDAVFLAGSTQEPEEEIALQTYSALISQHQNLRLILVPRHRERFESVAQLLDASKIPWQRRSRLEADSADPNARVLLVDAIGELGAWWGTAHAAFVGGSLGSRGGQNMIEPAAYGAAVSFGPNTRNFRDIVAMLLAAEAAVVVHDGAELTGFVRRTLVDRQYADDLGQRAKQLVSRQLGATARTFEWLLPLVEHSLSPARLAA